MKPLAVALALACLVGCASCRGVQITCTRDGNLASFSCDGAVTCPTIEEAKQMCAQMAPKEQRP